METIKADDVVKLFSGEFKQCNDCGQFVPIQGENCYQGGKHCHYNNTILKHGKGWCGCCWLCIQERSKHRKEVKAR
tara:strand:+ start:882 stop:1109 length:228 start_codon:yes stop_codon:yes gene_type:complete